MKKPNALSSLPAASFLIVLGLAGSACDESDQSTDSSDATESNERDVRGGNATEDDAGAVADTASEPEVQGGNSERYEELLGSNFDQCMDFCTAWEACGQLVLDPGETCDDFCEVDADILRVNIPDQAAGYDCMQAGVDAYACNAGLTCDEVSEYNTDPETTLCATEDANFGTFCREFF